MRNDLTSQLNEKELNFVSNTYFLKKQPRKYIQPVSPPEIQAMETFAAITLPLWIVPAAITCAINKISFRRNLRKEVQKAQEQGYKTTLEEAVRTHRLIDFPENNPNGLFGVADFIEFLTSGMRILTKGRELLINPYVAWKVEQYGKDNPGWTVHEKASEFQRLYNVQ